MLNHAVAQPQPRPPRMLLQWYSPPAVGNALAIWPMPSATTTAKMTPSGQPMPMLAPPAAVNPFGNAVMPPARMQMIEKLMAKLENPLMRRDSSCL